MTWTTGRIILFIVGVLALMVLIVYVLGQTLQD
jgi:hypothetical protein